MWKENCILASMRFSVKNIRRWEATSSSPVLSRSSKPWLHITLIWLTLELKYPTPGWHPGQSHLHLWGWDPVELKAPRWLRHAARAGIHSFRSNFYPHRLYAEMQPSFLVSKQMKPCCQPAPSVSFPSRGNSVLHWIDHGMEESSFHFRTFCQNLKVPPKRPPPLVA